MFEITFTFKAGRRKVLRGLPLKAKGNKMLLNNNVSFFLQNNKSGLADLT